MMCAIFNGNLRTIIISCYSPTNASDETGIITFYNEISSFVWLILKHNVLISNGEMNAQIGKDEIINFAYTTHQTEMGNISQTFHSKRGRKNYGYKPT